MSISPTHTIDTPEDLLAYAKVYCQSGSTGAGPVEVNFPAAIITLIDAYCHDVSSFENLDSIRKEAECGLLQLGFLNAGVNPLSTFIMAAYAEGWRYRGGFKKE